MFSLPAGQALLRKCESYKMPCPLPQMSVFLLRQGNSVLLLGPLLPVWFTDYLRFLADDLSQFCVDLFFPIRLFPVEATHGTNAHGGTFTFMHLADTFIQSDLQCIPAMRFWSVYSLQNQLWSGLFPVEATSRTNAQSVAWPSGLRRCIKAQVSLGAWVQIPPLPRATFF